MKPEAFFKQDKRFFFDDRSAAARYVKENCAAELAVVMRTADLAAEQKFLFQLRWDMEQTHIPEIFEGEIDWLRQPGNDPEFIFAFNRMRFWPCLGQAYAVTGDEKYAAAFARQLTGWVDTVKRSDAKNALAWRTIETGIRMENWCKAMAYFEGSPAITDDVMQRFVDSMTEHAEYIMSVWNSYNLMSNWGVLANHGLFVAGVMLPETERSGLYRSTALDRLSRELAIQVYPDGVQWEQSPMYHNEVLRCFLDVVLLARRNGIALPDGMESAVHRMARADLAQQKPNGCEPLAGDSDDIDQRDLVTLAAAIFSDGELKYAGYPKLDLDSAWELGASAASAYEALPSIRPEKTDFALTDSGNFVFRSGWSETDAWVRFHCGTLGAGHGHSDQLHFDFFANGEDVLTDAGRFTYVFGPERREFKNTSAHNSVTVDGEEYYVQKDSWECSRLSRAVNQKFFSSEKYGYAEGGHLGYYRQGVFVNRRLIYFKPDILVICDELYASVAHNYKQFLHLGVGFNVSPFDGGFLCESSRNTAFIKFASASAVSTELESTRVSRHYNKSEQNVSLVSSVCGSGFCSLFTVISLSRELSVEKLPVYSNFKGLRFDDSSIEALNIKSGERFYTLVVGHEEYASPTDTFRADGCTGFGSVVIFDRNAGENETGVVLLH